MVVDRPSMVGLLLGNGTKCPVKARSDMYLAVGMFIDAAMRLRRKMLGV